MINSIPSPFQAPVASGMLCVILDGSFVKVEKNQSSTPSEADMKKAMVDSGGTPGEVAGTNAARTLTYTGVVNHTVYENKLIEIAKGKRTSWNFVWADAQAA